MLAATSSEWLSVPDIAREMSLSRSKVHCWIKAGELRAVNTARSLSGERPRWAIRRSDLESFLESRAATPPAPKPARRVKSDCPQYILKGGLDRVKT